jgi:regulator of ribosome biosynthesis
MTKWQAFATAKGIAPKPRRDRLIFDEEKQDWVPKWGYKGKNKEIENQWIVEVPADKGQSFSCSSRLFGYHTDDLHERINETDPNFDPVNASKEDRKARKLKNESQRLKNLQRAAANEAAASSSKPKQPTAASNAAMRAKRLEVLDRDLRVTKTSTASMGKFDKVGDGEKKEKHVKRKVIPFVRPFYRDLS